MNQKKMSIMLKTIAVFAGIMGIICLAIIMPFMARECRIMYEEAAYLYWPGMCFGWLIGVLFFIALYQFWKICNEIGRDNSFSEENMRSLNIISVSALAAAGICFVGLVSLILNGTISIGFFVLMSLLVFVSLTISIIATVLSHLVKKAYELKQESEFTI